MLHTRLLFLLFPVWLFCAPAAAAPVTWQAALEIASGPGEKGPWQQNESRYRYVDDPAALMDAQDGLAVAWVDQSSKDVFFQRYSADGQPQLQQALNVSRNPETFSWLPRLQRAPDAANHLYLVWQEIIFSGGSHGGDILFARSTDGGHSFSNPINLSRSTGGDGKGRINAEVWDNGSFDLAAGPNGALYVTWTEYEGALWFSRSQDGGNTFSQPQRLAGGEGSPPARAPALALAPDGRIYLAWTVGEDEGANIHLTSSSDGGASFGAPTTIAESGQYADAPKLAVDGQGRLHLAYAQSEGGPFARYQVLYTRSDDGARSFPVPRTISQPLPASAQSARFPSLGVDTAGRVYISYELYPDHRRAPRGLGLSISQDGGDSFSAPAAIPGSASPDGGINGSQQGKLMNKLAVGRDGRLVIANSSLLEDERSRVWLIRGEVAGETAAATAGQ